MKITLDSNTNEVKVGKTTYSDLDKAKQYEVHNQFRKFLKENVPMTDYEIDSMWMSYRYCIGRHTIASHMHAGDIWKNCQGRLTSEKCLFTAFDINREIENVMNVLNPAFHFPMTNENRIYATAIDMFCEFLNEYDIRSTDDLIKYRDVDVIRTDNERGYKFETTTWEEWLRPQVLKICQKWYKNDALSEDNAWRHFEDWMNNKDDYGKVGEEFDKLAKYMPIKSIYSMSDFEDLFVWNDLVHCFDYEHWHFSKLKDGLYCKWFWSWISNTEQREDGNYYKAFGYHKVRIPVFEWNSSVTKWIPDDSIEENIY